MSRPNRRLSRGGEKGGAGVIPAENRFEASRHRLCALGGKPGVQLALVWLLVLLSMLPTVGVSVKSRLAQPRAIPSWVEGDIDTGLIMQGLRDTKTVDDMLAWWTGPWVGIVPFYRPLTSYLFWCEWKAFGVNEPAYLLPTVVLHLAATLMFAGFAWALARHLRHPWPMAAGAVAGAVFSGLPGTPRISVTSLVSMLWKNQPDSAAAFCTVGALWLYLLAIRGRRGALAGAMALYLAACGFKEIAVPLPVICLALEPDLHFWRRPAFGRLAAMGAIGLFFLTVRFFALHGMGYTYGSNDSMLLRTATALLGPFGVLTVGNWLIPTTAVILAVWVYLAVRRCRRVVPPRPDRVWLWRERAIWALWAAGGLAVLGWLGGVEVVQVRDLQPWQLWTLDGWGAGLLHLLINAWANDLHLMLITIAILLFLARTCPRLLGLGFAWVLTLMLPLTLSPGPVHRYYLPEGGYALIGGLGLAWLPVLARRAGSEPGKGGEQR